MKALVGLGANICVVDTVSIHTILDTYLPYNDNNYVLHALEYAMHYYNNVLLCIMYEVRRILISCVSL